MEIFLDKRAVRYIRMSAADAIEEGDTQALRDDIMESFPEDRIEALEQVLAGGDLLELLSEVLEEWSGDDVDELFDLLEAYLTDHGVDLRYHNVDQDEGLGDDDDYDNYDDDV